MEVQYSDVNHHMSSNCLFLSVCMSLFLISLVYYFFFYIFLTLTNFTLVTQTSPSSIFHVDVLHVSGRFKRQGDCCHFIFAFCSLNIHFTSCSDCGSEERNWRPVSSFHIWLRPEPFFPNSSFLFLLSFTEFHSVQSSQSSFHVTDLSVFLCTHQTCISNGFEKQYQNRTHTRVSSPLTFLEAQNKELIVCTFYPLIHSVYPQALPVWSRLCSLL